MKILKGKVSICLTEISLDFRDVDEQSFSIVKPRRKIAFSHQRRFTQHENGIRIVRIGAESFEVNR